MRTYWMAQGTLLNSVVTSTGRKSKNLLAGGPFVLSLSKAIFQFNLYIRCLHP